MVVTVQPSNGQTDQARFPALAGGVFMGASANTHHVAICHVKMEEAVG